ncbi:helix-turn-helix domain-containing protein [Actinosynnema sp. NPDC020468]|uniref:winged helix-turn-helix transcriptional regulator n=1 Tax=Actinosynnema sp. NPDC020468 TaxID=3154488 RepID=UPI0033EFA7C5
MRFLADCRSRLAFDLLANTWNPVVLWALKDGPLRHGELSRTIGGIRQKVLTETLRRLTGFGLVERTDAHYRLTALGESLIGPIAALGAWAFEHGDEVLLD